MDNEKGNTRISWMDIAKGISIMCIVLGHTSTGFLNTFCFSFNSVIFFILSGMSFGRIRNQKDSLLCFDNRETKIFLKKSVANILLPYFIWGGVSILIYFLMEGIIISNLQNGNNEHFSVGANFLGLLYGNSETGYFEYYRPLWFLPCLLMVEIIWFILLKIMYCISEKKAWMLYGISMGIFVLFGILESIFGWDFVLPFETESAIFMSFYFGIGLFLRSKGEQYYERFRSNIMKKGVRIVLSLIWLGTALLGIYLNGGTDTRSDYFSNIFLFIFNSLWMSLGVICISATVRKFELLEYIGKRTMAILVLHKYPIMFFKLFSYIQIQLQKSNVVIEFVITVFTIMLCLIAERIISKFLPQLFGQRKINVNIVV